MPCPTNAPINLLTTTNQPCDTKCNFEYNYGVSTCTMTNVSDKGKSYLDIQCFDGSNRIKCDMISDSLDVTSVRLYAKSLNTYSGFHADAELIITHSGKGRYLYVCIPIIKSTEDNLSSKWFSKVLRTVTSTTNEKVSCNTNNLTLNDVIPTAAFTIYDGGTFDWDCGEKNVIILFNKDAAVNMRYDEYKKLTSVVKSMEEEYVMGEPGKNLQYNKIGTSAGPGRKTPGTGGKSMTCTPITYPDGTIIPPGENNKVGWSKPDGSMPDTGNTAYYIMAYLGPILTVLAAIIVVAILGFAFMKLRRGAKSMGSASSTKVDR